MVLEVVYSFIKPEEHFVTWGMLSKVLFNAEVANGIFFGYFGLQSPSASFGMADGQGRWEL